MALAFLVVILRRRRRTRFSPPQTCHPERSRRICVSTATTLREPAPHLTRAVAFKLCRHSRAKRGIPRELKPPRLRTLSRTFPRPALPATPPPHVNQPKAQREPAPSVTQRPRHILHRTQSTRLPSALASSLPPHHQHRHRTRTRTRTLPESLRGDLVSTLYPNANRDRPRPRPEPPPPARRTPHHPAPHRAAHPAHSAPPAPRAPPAVRRCRRGQG